MSRTILTKLNNLNYSDIYVGAVYDYIKNGNMPLAFDSNQRYNLKKHYKDFKIVNDKLYYTPLNLEVVKESEREELLKRLYDDVKVGVGSGIQSFYNKITSKYIGISRKQIKEFLENQEPYQLTKSKPYPINKPIIALYPNHRWAVDLIDMMLYESKNRHYLYILTVIDFFSRYVFAVGLTDKTSPTIINGLDDIIKNQAQNTYPLIIQADNGGEFKSDVMTEWAREHKVKIVHTLSYKPQSNGLIENFNGILRKMIREGFIRSGDLNWIDHLSDYIINRNNSKQKTTKNLPINIWRSGREKIGKLTQAIRYQLNNKITIDKDDLMHKALINVENKAKRDVARTQPHNFLINEHVRALNSSLYSKIRKMIKAGNNKLVVVKYSPEIFRIRTKKEPTGDKKDFQTTRYTLSHADGSPVQTELKLNNPNRIRGAKFFYGTELQRVDENIITKTTTDISNKLNYAQEVELERIRKEEEDKLIIDGPRIRIPNRQLDDYELNDNEKEDEDIIRRPQESNRGRGRGRGRGRISKQPDIPIPAPPGRASGRIRQLPERFR